MSAKKQFSLRSKILLLIISSSFLITLIFSFVLISSVNQSKKVAAELISRSSKIEDLGRINFLFKSEVQMWKDVLIRGSDPESFNKYTAEMKKFRTDARNLVISKAVGQLDHTSQTNAASAEETAGASMLLQEQSVKLQSVMSDLRSVIHG